MQENTEVTDFLMPGHVWVHRKKRTPAIVLFTANSHLPEKFASAYPQTVVYLDTNGNITTATFEQFTRTRDFDHVDPDVENAITNLQTAVSAADEEVVLEDDTEEHSGDTKEEPAVKRDEVFEAPKLPAKVIDSEFFTSSNQALPLIAADALSEALEAYQARPAADGVYHHMMFRLNDVITLESLFTAFSSDIVRYNSARVTDIQVSWDEFKGIWPSVTTDGTSAVAVFLEGIEAAKKPAAKAKPTKKPEAGKESPEANA